jgi:hypothetical protein
MKWMKHAAKGLVLVTSPIWMIPVLAVALFATAVMLLDLGLFAE